MSFAPILRNDNFLLCYFHPRTNFFGAYAIFQQCPPDDTRPLYCHRPKMSHGNFYCVAISERRGQESIIVERGTRLRISHGKFYLRDWQRVCIRAIPPDQDGFLLLQKIVHDPAIYLMELLLS